MFFCLLLASVLIWKINGNVKKERESEKEMEREKEEGKEKEKGRGSV